MISIPYSDLIAPSFYEVWNDVIRKRYPEIWLAGGRGCVDGSTLVDTPHGSVAIKDFCGGEVFAYDGSKVVTAVACKPLKYTIEKLYRITLDSGKSILCTDEHRFLTSSGWKMTKDLAVGEVISTFQSSGLPSASCDNRDSSTTSCETPNCSLPLLTFSSSSLGHPNEQEPFPKDTSSRHLSNDALFREELHGDVLHSMQTLLSCLYRYWQDFRLCDEPPLTEVDTYRDLLQRLACVPEHIRAGSQKDGSEQDGRCSHCVSCVHRPSKQDCHCRKEDKCCEATGNGISRMLFESLSRFAPSMVRYLESEDLDGSIQLIAQHLLSSTSSSDSSECGLCGSDASSLPKSHLGCDSVQMLSDMLLRKVGDESYSAPMKVDVCSHGRNDTKADRIVSIEFEKEDYYYDMFVPFYNNYFANGILNHNSTKSSFVSTAIVLLMEMNPNLHCCCFRRYAANLADSVYAQFEFTICQKLRPIAHHWAFKKSPLKIVNVNTGQQIIFRGLDDPQKVKSLKAPFGYWGLTWYEELAEFDCIEEVRNVNQSLHRGGHYFQTFCSYNPPETTANWVNYEAAIPQIVNGKEYRKVYRSDYRMVPRDWLGENFFIEAELLKNTNPRAYAHEYLGEVTGNGGSIFPNVKSTSFSDYDISQFSNRRFGLDWGFAIDPACWLAMNYDKTRRTISIYDEIYDVGMTNPVFAGLIKEKDMGYSYLMCDSAEPKSIAEFESLGINALAAQKGPDSVRFSTKWLQGLCNVFIDPIRCPNAYREFSQYEYAKNKNGMFVSKYPDLNNHSIDACRYALMEDAIEAGLF